MKKRLTLIFMASMFSLLLSCSENPMNSGLISSEEFAKIQSEKLKGTLTVWAPSAKPVFIKFENNLTTEKVTNVQSDTKNWHISSYDATWRFGANSGTTAAAYGSGGDGEVKVYELAEGETFNDIKSINHQGFSAGHKDQVFEVNGNNQNLNYALTEGIKNGTETVASPTYLFKFNMSGMGTGGPLYEAGSKFIFLISDGNGENWVKLQPIEITTDNPGSMSFTERKYVFKYAMADADGNFN